MQVPVNGECESRFRAVRDAFERGFERHDELGAAVSVVVDGRPVVDLWGGFRDAARTLAWERDTLVNVWSISKAVTAVCLAMLADRGQLDVDAPVAAYWPEFAAEGKHEIRVSSLLAHQAGLPGLRTKLPDDSHLDWQVMTEALAQERPWWKPGTALGYHWFTWGWLAGELLRRVDGRSVGAFIRAELAEPLGLDFHLGTPPEIDARIAPIAGRDTPVAWPVLLYWVRTPHRMPMRMCSLDNPHQSEAKVDSRAWRAAEIPAANGISNARGLARLFGVLARERDEVRSSLLGSAALARAIGMQADGRDLMFGYRSRFGLGFMLDSPSLGIASGSRSFGHTGAGGGFAFADPDRGIGFAYTPNRRHPQSRLLVPQARNLIRAIYASI